MPALVAEDVDEMLRPSWVSAREGRRARVGERERSSREGGGGRAGARAGGGRPHTLGGLPWQGIAGRLRPQRRLARGRRRALLCRILGRVRHGHRKASVQFDR